MLDSNKFDVTLLLNSTEHSRNNELQENLLNLCSLIDVTLSINGTKYKPKIEPRVTLLDALREYIGLTATKKGCNQGTCGACTVLVNGQRINSCLTLAVMHVDKEITTIEGLANGDELHPMQAAFTEYDSLQCGYCTPGQICSAVAMLEEVVAGEPSFVTEIVDISSPIKLSNAEIRERMSGNICRYRRHS